MLLDERQGTFDLIGSDVDPTTTQLDERLLADAKTADEYIKLLGIEVTYAGTRTSKPMDIPAAAPDKDAPAPDKK